MPVSPLFLKEINALHQLMERARQAKHLDEFKSLIRNEDDHSSQDSDDMMDEAQLEIRNPRLFFIAAVRATLLGVHKYVKENRANRPIEFHTTPVLKLTPLQILLATLSLPNTLTEKRLQCLVQLIADAIEFGAKLPTEGNTTFTVSNLILIALETNQQELKTTTEKLRKTELEKLHQQLQALRETLRHLPCSGKKLRLRLPAEQTYQCFILQQTDDLSYKIIPPKVADNPPASKPTPLQKTTLFFKNKKAFLKRGLQLAAAALIGVITLGIYPYFIKRTVKQKQALLANAARSVFVKSNSLQLCSDAYPNAIALCFEEKKRPSSAFRFEYEYRLFKEATPESLKQEALQAYRAKIGVKLR